jgi:Sortase domain
MMDDEQHGRRNWPWMTIVAVLLVVAGTVALGVGVRAQRHAPQPPASAAVIEPSVSTSVPQPTYGALATPGTVSGKGTPGGAAIRGPVLPSATPTKLSIPSIGVNSSLLRLGLNSDQTAQVPPQSRKAQAGWFRYSPAPGQLGPSILLGHVDSAKYGPGVFFKLGALRQGATVSITRSDNTVAVFRVERVVSYSKDNFPTFQVYGNTDHAALRLITCGGKFNFSKHSYESNIVAYASLVSSHRA